MFVAVDHEGRRLNAIDTAEADIRLLSKAGLLHCPECMTPVRFAHGERVSAHFKHVHSPECTYESEPETDEHIKGKVMIRNWLKERYPEAQVEFEYKIIETNQRADLIAHFPQGKRLAFEMQCSKITGSAWLERHKLYESAGIVDYWILGGSVHKYARSHKDGDKPQKHQLISLAEEIYKKMKSVVFLDTGTGNVKGLYDLYKEEWHSDTILLAEEKNFSLEEASIFKKWIAIPEIKRDWLKDEKERKIFEEKNRIQLEERARREEQEERDAKRLEEESQANFNQYKKTILGDSLKSAKNNMTAKELTLFEQLLQKYKLTEENFPGCLNVYTPYDHLIKTPRQLWQLWIYDSFINRKPASGKVYVPKIKDLFFEYHRSRTFRINFNHSDKRYSFAIYRLFNIWNQIGIVTRLGAYTAKYYKIEYTSLPLVEDKEFNSQVALYLSLLSIEQENYDSSHFQLKELTGNEEAFEKCRQYVQRMDQHQEEQMIEVVKASGVLEYIYNFTLVNKELASEWESEFISKTYQLARKGHVLSEKQRNVINKMKDKIEKELNISLG